MTSSASADSRSIVFAGDRVGLIVRGKASHSHHPKVMQQHADCVLSNGSPVGFFGEGNSGSFNGSGLGMQGIVYDFDALSKKRAPYTDANIARTVKMVSTIIHFTVSQGQAQAFDDYWKKLKSDPGSFNILGGNCSTHASDAFIQAKILSGGIPGLDTPDHLYAQLWREKKGRCSVASGYIGFTKSNAGYLVTVERA